uniref:Si:ch211-165i18.2 n=1 Tax=Sinocyclocheilus rhinocerous TaxID=307959 RepID=A0A673GRJ9_9TELE
MFVLGLLTCVVLRAFSAQAKVVTSFYECRNFFYKDTEPGGMDQNAKKICQVYNNEGSKSTYYATLYSVLHRLPLYSAYTLDPACKSFPGKPCNNNWHVEPQISPSGSDIDYMVRETIHIPNIKENHAISSDYSETGYDRGHLNPNSFQCGIGRKATCTLTNAAPMDACFNRIHWYKWESTLRGLLLQKLISDGTFAKAYIVTGTVPNANPNERMNERVTVPPYIWTAVCYKHNSDDGKSFSFGYIGRNRPEGGISLKSVSDLNEELSRHYSQLLNIDQSIRIFADDCFGDNNKLNMVRGQFQKLINLPVNQAVQMSSGIQSMYLAVNTATSSDSIPAKKVKVSEMTVKLAFDSMSTYYNVAEELKDFPGTPCLITYAKPLVGNDELMKRDVSDAVECLLVPEKQKTAADGSICSSVSESSYSFQCNTGGEIKSCCSSPCLYQDKLKGYRCYSAQKLIECSPPYSLITYKGDRCKDDSPCATYGYDYYWCKTISGSWDYCSPPLWRSKAKNGQYCRSNHACAKYGEKRPWCYTDDKINRDECCTSDDCYSAVNHKTCRSGHTCGYHGKKHLWCYMDEKGNWDYCCKDCSQ